VAGTVAAVAVLSVISAGMDLLFGGLVLAAV
jgi:hypothetical protein